MTIRFRPRNIDGVEIPNEMTTDLPFVGKYLEVPWATRDGYSTVRFERVRRSATIDGTTFYWWDIAPVMPAESTTSQVLAPISSRFEREIVL